MSDVSRLRVTIHLGPQAPAVAARAAEPTNAAASRAVQESLTDYFACMTEELRTIELTATEALLCCELAGPPPSQRHRSPNDVAAMICNALRNGTPDDQEQRGVNFSALAERITLWSPGQRYAFADAITRWWRAQDTEHRDSEATLIDVGLLRPVHEPCSTTAPRRLAHLHLAGDPIVREDATDYVVALHAGSWPARSASELREQRDLIARHLDTTPGRIVVRPGASPYTAIVTHVTREVGRPRVYAGPRVNRGTIVGVGRLAAGGEANVTIRMAGSMIHTIICGPPVSGKTNAVRILMYGALAESPMNVICAGNIITRDITERARVVVVGQDNLIHLPRLIRELVAARQTLAADLNCATLPPSAELPGLLIVHDDFHPVAPLPHQIQHLSSNKFGKMGQVGICGIITTTRHQETPDSLFGHTSSPRQFIVLARGDARPPRYVRSFDFDPADLRDYSAGHPVPGLAAHDNQHSPVELDYLPRYPLDNAPTADGRPPLTITTAAEQYFVQPPLHQVDVDVLTRIFGEPADDGRWTVIPGEGKHRFPSSWT